MDGWRSTKVDRIFWPFVDARKLAEAENFTKMQICSCSTPQKWSQATAPGKYCIFAPDKVQNLQIFSGTHRLR